MASQTLLLYLPIRITCITQKSQIKKQQTNKQKEEEKNQQKQKKAKPKAYIIDYTGDNIVNSVIKKSCGHFGKQHFYQFRMK